MRRDVTRPSGDSSSMQWLTRPESFMSWSLRADLRDAMPGSTIAHMTTPPWKFPLEPARDKPTLRRQLKAERLAMTDRHQRSVHMQEVLRVWLVTRPETSIGAYWPIKGEFDAMPALFRWTEGEPYRLIGLPVIDRDTKQLDFHVWYPGCPMEEDAYGIPKPK